MTLLRYFGFSKSLQTRRRDRRFRRSRRVRWSLVETLESRLAPAVVVVDVAEDSFDIPSLPTLADLPGPDGQISLREAVVASNRTPGQDTILFDTTGIFSTPQTILLDSGEMLIEDDLSIFGPGADRLSIDAQRMSRAVRVDDGLKESLETVVLERLRIAGGRTSAFFESGGGIQNHENLVLNDVVLDGNSTEGGSAFGGGIFNAGRLTMSRSYLTNNSTVGATGRGGAIYNQGRLSIQYSELAGNHTRGRNGDGGAIASRQGEAVIENSSLVHNHTQGEIADGGAIFSDTDLSSSEVTQLVNVTLSSNRTAGRGGGVFNLDGDTLIYNSTITRNEAPEGQGGGIASYGDTMTRTTLASTIVAANLDADLAIVDGSTDSFRTSGANLLGRGAVSAFMSTDQVEVLDPGLGDLADYGGPTRTHALLGTSPAIDRGANPLTLPYDQRGSDYERVVGDATDVGAWELFRGGPQVVGVIRNRGVDRLDQISTLRFEFSEDVAASLDVADLTLVNQQTFQLVDLSQATVVPTVVPHAFRFDLGNPLLLPGSYRLVLEAQGVVNALGDALDGDGDGRPGGDYQTILPVAQLGDINLDQSVDAFDASLLFSGWASVGHTWASGDHNFDGIVDAADAGVMFEFWTG